MALCGIIPLIFILGKYFGREYSHTIYYNIFGSHTLIVVLAIGAIPFFIYFKAFLNRHGYWKIQGEDFIVCGRRKCSVASIRKVELKKKYLIIDYLRVYSNGGIYIINSFISDDNLTNVKKALEISIDTKLE